MKHSPEARAVIKRLNPALCVAGGALTLCLGRVAALYVLARGFEQYNLNEDTYALAPALLRFLADNAGETASLFGLMLACCALLLIKSGASPFGSIRKRTLLLLPCGAAVGGAAVCLLYALDEIRFLPAPFRVDLPSCALWLCLSVFMALWLRGAFDPRANGYAAAVTSMVLQALFALYLFGRFEPALLVNALLFGFVSTWLYRKYRSVLPEIFLFFGFVLGHRLLSGYPAQRGFYVHANLLNGGDAGLFGSILPTALLALMAAVIVIQKRKEASHGEKAIAHRQSLRGTKKGDS